MTGGDVLVHQDQAARLAAAFLGAHAFCYDGHVFLGPTVGTPLGPTLAETLTHELVHVAQVAHARQSGKVDAPERLEGEAVRLSQDSRLSFEVACGAAPDECYRLWWLLVIAAAAYVILRPNVANAPTSSQDKTYPSVSEAQVAGEAIALFAVPEATAGVAGRLGLGLMSRMAVANACSMMAYQGVEDAGRGELSSASVYVYDGITGAAIGYIVPGGIKLFGSAGVASLDWLAVQGIRQSDLAITRVIADSLDSGMSLSNAEVAAMLENRGAAGRASQWWLDRRGMMVLYRGQSQYAAEILSPYARDYGVGASEALVQQMRAAGLTDQEIALYTAQWHTTPVPGQFTFPELAGQPLGAAGIPTTTIPGVAANFGKGGVVYIIRLPAGSAIKVPPWGLAVENEWVVLNKIPEGSIVDVVPATSLPALEVDDAGRLMLGRRVQ
jgi:hypothetical protein